MYYIRKHISDIIQDYQGEMPLSEWLKQYLSKHKKLGSRDRKMIKEAVYAYYRVAGFTDESKVEIILRHAIQSGIVTHPRLIELYRQDIEYTSISSSRPVPYLLSEGMSQADFYYQITHQPRVFLRAMGKSGQHIGQLLRDAAIDFETLALNHVEGTIYAVNNAVPLQDLLPEHAYLVQDFSSQRCMDIAYAQVQKWFASDSPLHIWDVCSGAGGKTILLHRLWPQAKIIATDIRASILANLRNRMRRYGLKGIKTMEVDMSVAQHIPEELAHADLILCDVPCSGSGTWGRTPEQFYFFTEQKLNHYVSLQRSIMDAVLSRAKQDAVIIYITCSVLTLENEAQIDYLRQTYHCAILHQQLVNGISQAADSMYVSVLHIKR